MERARERNGTEGEGKERDKRERVMEIGGEFAPLGLEG